MENENAKVHTMMKFIKAVASALPDILLFIGIYFLVFSLVFGLAAAIENDAKSEVFTAENEYLKGQIEWYQAQLADEPHMPASAIIDGNPDE